MGKTDKEIVDNIETVFYNSLKRDVAKMRKEYKGDFAEGYIKCMETTAKFVLDIIDRDRGEQ